MYQNKLISNENNIRLDKYLTANLELNRSQIKKLIDNHSITVNGKFEKSGYQLEKSDIIEIFYENELKIEKEDIYFKILFEDEDIAVISKPQNLVVHPGNGNFKGTLVNGLLYKFDKLADTGDEQRPGIVHRLDKDTSGLMIIAKSNPAYTNLVSMFKNREIKKRYIAIVEGKIEYSGEVNAPIGRDVKNRLRFSVTDLNSKEALTLYEPLKVFERHSLISLGLETGRTHQIRVHMNYIGHPVLGDLLYGRKNKYNIKTQMLHAIELNFKHPITGESMNFIDEFPIRFTKFLKRADI